ncbi:MAG: SIS domain-containing protein [Candidatus Komeilibacteria bacterium]
MNKVSQQQASVYQSIGLLPAQLEQGWQQTAEADWPVGYKNFRNVVICGMGGSNIGYDLVRHVLGDQIKVPIILRPDYTLPGFVNKQTLVVLASYSGNTAEVLSCANEVKQKKLKGYVLSGGGKLAALHKQGVPGLIWGDNFNPSKQPRWGLGYSIGAFLQVLKKAKLVSLADKKFLQANQTLADDQAIAKLGKAVAGKALLLVGAEHLIGNAHILANQVNETAKQLAWWLTLPDLNHHWLEALQVPRAVIKQYLQVIFLNSSNYSEEIQKRIRLTQNILSRQKVAWAEMTVTGDSLLHDSFSTLQSGSYLCYHISVANKVDPIAIPWVDEFKKALSSKAT